jgi:hypothetical protein
MIIYQDEEGTTDSWLVVVIEPDNLRRMKEHDPITLHSQTFGGYLKPIEHPKRFHMIVCYEEEVTLVYEYMKARDFTGLRKYLERGYQFTNRDGITLPVPASPKPKGAA